VGGNKDNRARLFSVVPTDKRRASGHKLKYGELHLSISRNDFTVRVVRYWHMLPKEAVESPSLELLKT